MPRYTFLAFTNPTPGKEDEFNAWYDAHHIPDVLDVPGFVSGRRFRLAQTQFEFNTQPLNYRYLALYEIETDDVAATLKEIVARAGTERMTMIDAIDMSTLNAPLFEEIGSVVMAGDVRKARAK